MRINLVVTFCIGMMVGNIIVNTITINSLKKEVVMSERINKILSEEIENLEFEAMMNRNIRKLEVEEKEENKAVETKQ